MATSGGEEPADHPVESLELLLRIRGQSAVESPTAGSPSSAFLRTSLNFDSEQLERRGVRKELQR